MLPGAPESDWFGTVRFLVRQGFDENVADAFREYTGSDLLSLDAEDAVDIAGPKEGLRLLELLDQYRAIIEGSSRSGR